MNTTQYEFEKDIFNKFIEKNKFLIKLASPEILLNEIDKIQELAKLIEESLLKKNNKTQQ